MVRILGVNAAGLEASNEAMCNGRDLPWLQDTADAAVWTAWAVAYRDVIVLDASNEKIATFNLTAHDLAQPEEYAALKAILTTAAGGAAAE